jgi:hypothetical protein
MFQKYKNKRVPVRKQPGALSNAFSAAASFTKRHAGALLLTAFGVAAAGGVFEAAGLNDKLYNHIHKDKLAQVYAEAAAFADKGKSVCGQARKENYYYINKLWEDGHYVIGSGLDMHEAADMFAQMKERNIIPLHMNPDQFDKAYDNKEVLAAIYDDNEQRVFVINRTAARGAILDFYRDTVEQKLSDKPTGKVFVLLRTEKNWRSDVITRHETRPGKKLFTATTPYFHDNVQLKPNPCKP